MMASSFSKRGQLIFCPLITLTCIRPRSGTSIAVPATSPSPVHVAPESFRHNRAACFTARRRDSYTTKERMQRNLHCKIRVQRLEGGGVGDVIDGIEPDLFRQGRVQHGGVDRLVER